MPRIFEQTAELGFPKRRDAHPTEAVGQRGIAAMRATGMTNDLDDFVADSMQCPRTGIA
jgi:hypothetical protein